jgi:predicted negative regulator of RcsB-dependent stress response
VARITRKELKTDKFALEVGHTVTFFEEHRQEVLRYGAVALVVVLLIAGIFFYSRYQRDARQAALVGALEVFEKPVGQVTPGLQSFPTAAARDMEGTKQLTEVMNRYAGSEQAVVAQYTLGSMAADAGRLAEAEKLFKDAVAAGNKTYGSLAKMSLAQIYFATGRAAEGEQLLKDVMANPSLMVSADEAKLALARGLAASKPAEARKIVEPLRASRNGAVAQTAVQIYSELPQ